MAHEPSYADPCRRKAASSFKRKAIEMDERASGLARVFDLRDMEGEANEEEQLDFLALEPMLGDIKRGGEVVNRGRGRPKGVINRKTSELAQFILSRHRNPVEAAAQIVDTPLPDLAAVLKCSMVEALDSWRRCAEFVARYTLQPMPQAVKVQTEVDGYITLINLSAPRPGEEEAPLSPFGIDMAIKETPASNGGGSGESSAN